MPSFQPNRCLEAMKKLEQHLFQLRLSLVERLKRVQLSFQPNKYLELDQRLCQLESSQKELDERIRLELGSCNDRRIQAESLSSVDSEGDVISNADWFERELD